jgi:hypothetical protein
MKSPSIKMRKINQSINQSIKYLIQGLSQIQWTYWMSLASGQPVAGVILEMATAFSHVRGVCSKT